MLFDTGMRRRQLLAQLLGYSGENGDIELEGGLSSMREMHGFNRGDSRIDAGVTVSDTGDDYHQQRGTLGSVPPSASSPMSNSTATPSAESSSLIAET